MVSPTTIGRVPDAPQHFDPRRLRDGMASELGTWIQAMSEWCQARRAEGWTTQEIFALAARSGCPPNPDADTLRPWRADYAEEGL